MEITEEELKTKIEEAVAKAKEGLLTQEQFDSTLSKRINEVNEKHKKELAEKEKIAKMTAEEKQKHDFDTLTKENEELKSSLAAKDHKEKLNALMSEKKVDSSFYDMFSGIADLEKAGALMDKFNETFTAKVNEELDSKIKSNVPSINKNNDNTSLRKAMGL